MAISGSVQYNGGLLPDITLLTLCYYHRGARLNAMKFFFLSLQSIFPSKRFDVPPSSGGCSEGLDAFRFTLDSTSGRLQSNEKCPERSGVAGRPPALAKGRHTARLWSLTLSASLRTAMICFS